MSFSEQDMEEFKAEALELLEVAEKSLLALDQGGDFRPAFDAAFRGFHNLKGAAGMMELTRLQAHTHELENILMRFKDSTQLPQAYVSLFLRGIDAARVILNGEDVAFDYTLPEDLKETEASSLTASVPKQPAKFTLPDAAMEEFVAESEEIVGRISDALQLVEAKTFNKETLEALYRDIHSLKGAAFLFSFQTLGNIAHAMESSLEAVRDGTRPATEPLLNALFNALTIIESEVFALKSKTKVQGSEVLVPNIVRALALASGDMPVANSAVILATPPAVAPSDIFPPVQAAAPVQIEATSSQPAVHAQEGVPMIKKEIEKDKDNETSSSIRVSVALLDNLMTLMGEMVLVRNQVLQFSSKSEDLEFLNLSKRLNVVTSEIQGEMMKTRMQPVGNILSKFNRVVRDLSHELKKEITLNLSGADTELDKSLLESIKDPLTHIVRNSCDHGIETPEVRAASGKSKNGTIHIRSYHEGGQVVIEVADDGKGLHREVLLKKALEKGLLTQAQAAQLSEKETFNLIFAPGFSTAAAITNVSGRGVGMDVVRTNVERIGGAVELTSSPGRGTTTKLKIPLTLAIVPALIVRSSNESFAIPQVKLEELVRVDQSSADNKIELLHGSPVYRLRGNILPLLNLNKILGFKESSGTGLASVNNIAVLNADQCSFGLIIDEVLDTADIVVKPINRLLKSLHVYSGATILGDGSIALILDVMGIAKVAQIGNEKAKTDENDKPLLTENEHEEKQDFLVVRLNSPTKHALVLSYVHRLEEFRSSDIELSGAQRVIRYGKTILPILSTSEQLGYGRRQQSETQDKIPVVVIQKAGSLFALEVDEIVDTLSTAAEVDTALVKQDGIFGNLSTAEELFVIIDPFELIGAAYPDSSAGILSGATTSKNAATNSPSSVLNILLVEDTVFFRRAVSNVLTNAGHKVTSAVDGREAMDLLEQDPRKFDLIVSDIEMPRMNGFEFARAVRANKDTLGIPMMAISSRADKSYLEEGLKAGFNVYLEKLKPAVLMTEVHALTSKRRAA